MSAEQKLRDALEAVRKDLLLRKQVTGAKSVELGNSAWWMLEEALALPPDPPVPALRFYSMQEDVPHEGQMCIVKINGVIQSVPFEFDAHDDDYGGSNHFWGHEELDECPKVDWETDEWMPWPTEENTKAEPSVPELAPATNDLVDRFAFALKEKLQRAQEKYGHDDSWLCQWCDEVETVQKALALPAEPSVPVSELEALIKHIESLDTGSSYDPVISTAHCRRLVKKIIKKAKEQEK